VARALETDEPIDRARIGLANVRAAAIRQVPLLPLEPDFIEESDGSVRTRGGKLVAPRRPAPPAKA
jgi:hypothetical protein